MKVKSFNSEIAMNHWLVSFDEDTKAMYALFEAKSYSWALFVGHISIEKLLKAYYVKKITPMHPLHITFLD